MQNHRPRPSKSNAVLYQAPWVCECRACLSSASYVSHKATPVGDPGEKGEREYQSHMRSTDNDVCPQVCFNRVLGIHDTCGVHYTFGLPGLLGGITYIGLMAYQTSWSKDPM